MTKPAWLRPPTAWSPAAWIAALALVLALLLPGMRGIWDPDEGRYTNVAMHMLESGNWVEPHRSDEVGHWTKPPLTYWAIAASIDGFGRTPWAARLPAALSYLLCVWLAWRMAKRLAPGSEHQAALAYATMLLPVGAAQWITTDCLLAAFETLAMWGFVEARFGDQRRARRWLALMWTGFGLAFLTKGPPALLPLLVVAGFDLLTPATDASGQRRRRAVQWWSLPLFLAIAAPWYLVVISRHPGLLDYFLGAEVVGRVASNEFNRNGEWYGWLQVYVPTLVLGTLPWSPTLWRWLRGMPARLRAWRSRDGRDADRAGLLLALWVALPMLVFCLSRSRMPLYVLPLFVPLALLVARQRLHEGRGLPHRRWLLAWAAALLALQFAAAAWPTHKDGGIWQQAIAERAPGRIGQVLIVDDMARYSLSLQMGVDIEKLSSHPLPHPRVDFSPEYDEEVADELGNDYDADAIWLTKRDNFEHVRAHLRELGYSAEPQGTPYEGRVIFRVRPAGISPP
jgi:4-amino-4-deoxy-L-arabinose transferase-like glycosyltransferase